VLEILGVAHAFGAMVFALTAPVEVRDHSQPGIVPEIPERLPGIAVIEVAAPPSQEGVEVWGGRGRGGGLKEPGSLDRGQRPGAAPGGMGGSGFSHDDRLEIIRIVAGG
jgi:hypothetical protein